MGLNRKDGTLKGVKIGIKRDGKDWKQYRVQGWATPASKRDFSILYSEDEDNEIELTLSREALLNILDEIEDKDVLDEFIHVDMGAWGVENPDNNSTWTSS